MARILVVDDREEDRYLLQSLFTGVGHRVDLARDGFEALEVARREPPDLAASDIFMPRMDGFALCQAWRQDPRLKDIPFVFYSATFTGQDDETFAYQVGADRFLAKPLDPTSLLAAIQLVLAEQAAGTLAAKRRPPLDEQTFQDGHDQAIVRKLEQKSGQLKTSHQLLAEAEAKFRALVEQSLAGIYIVDAEGRITYANPRLAEIFGLTVAEARRRGFFDLVAEAERPAIRERFRGLLSAGGQNLQLEFGGRRADGAPVDIGMHASVTYLGGRPVCIGMLQDISEQKQAQARIDEYIGRLERSVTGTIQVVSRIVELRDPYTAGHERRVGELAVAIGRELGLGEHSLQGLRVIGLVHDVGKIAMPAELLSKPGRLNAIEFQIIQTHPEQGHEILRHADFPWPVAQAVLQHHERMDGSGYPAGLKAGAICLEARIIAVADVVEAMGSHRPYRPALSVDQALAEVEAGMGSRYDPDVAAVCLKLFRDKGYRLPD